MSDDEECDEKWQEADGHDVQGSEETCDVISSLRDAAIAKTSLEFGGCPVTTGAVAMKTLLRLSFLVCIVTSGKADPEPAQAADTQSSSFDIGGRKVVVPNPPGGFVRGDGINPKWDKAAFSMLPASNRMLGMFVTPEARDQIREGVVSDTGRNYNIQVLTNLESREIGERTFADVRRAMSKEIDGMKNRLDAELKKLAKSGNQKLETDFGVNAGLSISDTVMLGIFEQSDVALGFSMAMNIGVTTEKRRDESRSVVAAIMVPVNGRLVNLYSTVPYTSKADQEQAEAGVKKWRDMVVAANPRVQGPPGGFDWGRVGRSTGMGAAVGALVGLVGWMIQRLRRAPQ